MSTEMLMTCNQRDRYTSLLRTRVVTCCRLGEWGRFFLVEIAGFDGWGVLVHDGYRTEVPRRGKGELSVSFHLLSVA